jgi:hypothetical protein
VTYLVSVRKTVLPLFFRAMYAKILLED